MSNDFHNWRWCMSVTFLCVFAVAFLGAFGGRDLMHFFFWLGMVDAAVFGLLWIPVAKTMTRRFGRFSCSWLF